MLEGLGVDALGIELRPGAAHMALPIVTEHRAACATVPVVARSQCAGLPVGRDGGRTVFDADDPERICRRIWRQWSETGARACRRLLRIPRRTHIRGDGRRGAGQFRPYPPPEKEEHYGRLILYPQPVEFGGSAGLDRRAHQSQPARPSSSEALRGTAYGLRPPAGRCTAGNRRRHAWTSTSALPEIDEPAMLERAR